VCVVGDVTLDLLGHRKEKSNQWIPLSETTGGTFFVARVIEKALEGSGVDQITYQQPERCEYPQMLRAEWSIRKFPYPNEPGALVHRCVDKPKSMSIIKAPDDQNGNSYNPVLASELKPFELLVIEDLNIESNDESKWNTFHDRRTAENQLEWQLMLERMQQTEHPSEVARTGFAPTVVAMINRRLPDFSKGLWKALSEKHAKHTIAIIYADVLRWEGFNISKQISWERTAQDYLSELLLDFKMRPLANFQHLVVRFGVTGAIHSYKTGPHHTAHRLYFDPVAAQHGIYRDSGKEGDLIGNNSIYVASILKQLIDYVNETDTNRFNQYGIVEQIGSGIRNAICRCQKHFSEGYGYHEAQVETFMRAGGFQSVLFDESSAPTGRAESIADVPIPIGNASWSILDQSAEYDLLNVAQDIVLLGVGKALNKPRDRRPPVWAPVVKFGNKSGAKKLVAIDRREIESYRGVYNLMKEALNSPKDRPLSIAVFGPPGSGKTACVTQIAQSLDLGEDRIKRVNLAEFTSYEQLKNEVLKAHVDKMEEKGLVPLVFFDEFDCKFEKTDFGWLKHFLPFMENRDSRLPPTIRNGNPIFVFAGGTSYTFHDFTRKDPSVTEQERLRFIEAKGPDFTSRLRGHINILGLDPVNEFDRSYVVRRALWLRSILLDRIGQESSGDIERWFCPEIIRGMLKVSTYKHGIRSMRSIIDMCVKLGGDEGKYVSTSLPTFSQLSMHVDGKEFIDCVNNARQELEMIRQNQRLSST